MQKFVHLKRLDTKLQLISTFDVDYGKGFIYVETERQNDINQVERHSAICLMQKFVHLKGMDTKLQLISAFVVDHMKGFIYAVLNCR